MSKRSAVFTLCILESYPNSATASPQHKKKDIIVSGPLVWRASLPLTEQSNQLEVRLVQGLCTSFPIEATDPIVIQSSRVIEISDCPPSLVPIQIYRRAQPRVVSCWRQIS
ncbi:hypothetical protein BDZ94DRAFT_1256352 [Collybia nuda]|uniref:Uncharacterized protein n=1 Tax=Collybia nuda TaxID=64659 RepID=A0A9P5Y9N9_9AGAR|nr:hypothetical protein BDZ94DRAFT_1256352 [Collybia nuda]